MHAKYTSKIKKYAVPMYQYTIILKQLIILITLFNSKNSMYFRLLILIVYYTSYSYSFLATFNRIKIMFIKLFFFYFRYT